MSACDLGSRQRIYGTHHARGKLIAFCFVSYVKKLKLFFTFINHKTKKTPSFTRNTSDRKETDTSATTVLYFVSRLRFYVYGFKLFRVHNLSHQLTFKFCFVGSWRMILTEYFLTNECVSLFLIFYRL